MSEYIGNRGGIPIIIATLTAAGGTDANASYTFPQHAFRFVGNKGIMVANFSAATATTVTGVTLVSNNQSLPLLSNVGATVTALDAGLHILLFDKESNSINLIV